MLIVTVYYLQTIKLTKLDIFSKKNCFFIFISQIHIINVTIKDNKI